MVPGKRIARWFGKTSLEEVAVPGVWAFVFWVFSSLSVGSAGIYFAEWINDHQLPALASLSAFGAVLTAARKRSSAAPPAPSLPPALQRIVSEEERAAALLRDWANAPSDPDEFWPTAFRIDLGDALVNRGGGSGQRLFADRTSLVFLKPGPTGLRLIRFELDLVRHFGSPDSRVPLGVIELHDWRAGPKALPQFGQIDFPSFSFDLAAYPDKSPLWITGIASLQIRVPGETDERTIKFFLRDRAVAVFGTVVKAVP